MDSRFGTARVAATLVALLLLLTSTRLEAASVTLAWDASPQSTVTGYRLLYGTRSGAYTGQVDVGNRTQFSLLSIPEGTYYFVVVAYDANQVTSVPSAEVTAIVRQRYLPTTQAPDLDGDSRSDLAVWRSANGAWQWLSSAGGLTTGIGSGKLWGNAGLGDMPLSGDVDGDRVADLIVWRSSTGTWHWLTSTSGYTAGGSKEWGRLSLGDKPMLADVDGDGADDLIIWRASAGTWYWLTSSSNYDYVVAGSRQWGSQALGDVPMTGDFDADGRADLAVWRPTDGTWYWLNSSSGYAYQTAGSRQWGSAPLGDKPALTDMDGDGRADLTIWRASTGAWYWLNSSTGYPYASAGGKVMGLGSPTDIPIVK